MVVFSSRRRHTRYWRDWSSDVCSSDLAGARRAAASARNVGASLAGGSGETDGYVHLIRRIAVRIPQVVGSPADRNSVAQGKSVDLGGRRIIKKQNRQQQFALRNLLLMS